METPDEPISSYPEGYEGVEQHVNDTMRRVLEIDRMIETTSPNSKPVPTPPPPPGFGHRPLSFNRERTLGFLDQERTRVQKEGFDQIEKATPSTGGQLAGVARDQAREALFPNPFRAMSHEQRIGQQNRPRDIETSQDFADAKRLTVAAQRSRQAEADQRPVAPSAPATPSTPERSATTLRFLTMRANTRDISQANREPDRDRE